MTNKDLIVSVSGIRGIVGEGLTPDAALAFASALATYVNGGRVVLSRDGRPSGTVWRHAVLAGLMAGGCEVHDLGVVPTPTCGLAVRRVPGGRRHPDHRQPQPRPVERTQAVRRRWRVLTAAEGRKVQAVFDAGTFRKVPWNQLGKVVDCRQAEDWHRDRVLELVEVPRIRGRQLRVFLDANGGAGGPLGRRLLDAFQCRPVCVGCAADGFFEHPPEPVAENLREIAPLVAEEACPRRLRP